MNKKAFPCYSRVKITFEFDAPYVTVFYPRGIVVHVWIRDGTYLTLTAKDITYVKKIVRLMPERLLQASIPTTYSGGGYREKMRCVTLQRRQK